MGGFVPTSRAEDWPLFRHDPARTGVSGESLSGPLTPLWTVSTGGQWIISSPAVVENIVYVGVVESLSGLPEEQKGSLWALDAETGTRLWRFPAEGSIGPVYSSPAVTANGVYFACRDGNFYCLTRDGQLRWKYPTGGLDHSSPVITQGKVVFASGAPNRGLILALDAETGDLAWETDKTSPDGAANPQFTYTSLSADENSLYYLDRNGEGLALDSATGEVRWRTTVGQGAYLFTPTRIRDGVFFASDQNATSAGARQAETGEPLWSFPYDTRSTDSIVSSAAATPETLVFSVGSPLQSLVALQVGTGDLLWSRGIGQAIPLGFASSPAIADGTVFEGVTNSDGTGSLLRIRLDDGGEIDRFPLKSGVVSSPAISGRRIVLGDLGGNLYAFGAALDPGDVTGDGRVTVQDAVLLLKAAVGLATLSERQKQAGDIAPGAEEDHPAGDGQINALDAVAVLQKTVGS